MIEIFVYRDQHKEVEEGLTADHLPELLRNESILVWVDMQAPTLDDDQILLDIFRFHPLTVEDCRANRHHPKVDEFPDYLYFIFHGVHTDSSVERFNTVELDGYLGRNFVVTYHHEPLSSIDLVKQKIRTTPLVFERGSSFLLHQIIDQLVDDYLPVMDDFDERINKLEDGIFTLKQPNNQILEEILGLKRSVLRLRRISSKELETLYRISHGQFHLIDGPVLPFYRDIYDHLVRVTDLAESYRDLISGSLDAY
ncbi:MAG: magnesium transporter CorA family protein, partial [Pyrinomonadaceae bacterium]